MLYTYITCELLQSLLKNHMKQMEATHVTVEMKQYLGAL
jgi:hypothetical protein